MDSPVNLHPEASRGFVGHGDLVESGSMLPWHGAVEFGTAHFVASVLNRMAWKEESRLSTGGFNMVTHTGAVSVIIQHVPRRHGRVDLRVLGLAVQLVQLPARTIGWLFDADRGAPGCGRGLSGRDLLVAIRQRRGC